LTDPACLAGAQAQGFAGHRIEVEIARDHLGTPGVPQRYAIIIVPPR
jgi:hypothetical protein